MSEPLSHMLFTYGTLQTGEPLNYILTKNNSELIDSATTYDKKFLMDIMDFFPIAVDVGENRGMDIVGEVWNISNTCLEQLDVTEQEGVLYLRKVETISTQGQKVLNAWMYVFNPVVDPNLERTLMTEYDTDFYYHEMVTIHEQSSELSYTYISLSTNEAKLLPWQSEEGTYI